VLFLLCTFGYMIFIIVYKMCVDWTSSTVSPPNLVVTMIDMFLSPGGITPAKQLYEGQGDVQMVFLGIAFISVPWMLFGPPCVIKSKVNAARERTPVHLRPAPKKEDGSSGGGGGGGEHGGMGLGEGKEEKTELLHGHGGGAGTGEEGLASGGAHGGGEAHAHGMPADIWAYSFSDSMITAGIHTIEYVLGTVSNTASYLRLWALSLAHSELAQVFWSKILMQYGIGSGNFFIAFIGMAVWAGATFFVLLCMDALECFLHALRLHWVEFQNKFYYADGYLFDPFSFDTKDISA